MSDMTGFLLARIAEDEAAAREAVIPAHDGYKPHPDLAHWLYEEGGEVEYVRTTEMLAHPYADNLYVTCDSEGIHSAVTERVGPHIARHDPARVLAECEAKRRTVAAATLGLRGFSFEVHVASLEHNAAILRSLAAVYADHPDYDESWRA